MHDERPRIGISSCLLGQPVRYDAGHKRDAFLVETFGAHVHWMPVCPEVEAGFGTPRETMRLVLTAPVTRERGARYPAEHIRLVTRDGREVTDQLRRYAVRKAEQLASAELDGYILKKDSPSCGMERVKVYGAGAGPAERAGRGLFADALMARLPNLPVEEEGRLEDPRLRENFVERVFAHRRLRALFAGRWSRGDLVRFHTAHKLTVMAHSPAAYQQLGRLVANARGQARASIEAEYSSTFMRALAAIATPRRHVNVLQHMLGYFKKTLDADGRAELATVIEEYGRERVPLIVPLTLMRHHVRRLKVEYLQGQAYLDPHPHELGLRSHV